jgi:hypothetical protein
VRVRSLEREPRYENSWSFNFGFRHLRPDLLPAAVRSVYKYPALGLMVWICGQTVEKIAGSNAPVQLQGRLSP